MSEHSLLYFFRTFVQYLRLSIERTPSLRGLLVGSTAIAPSADIMDDVSVGT